MTWPLLGVISLVTVSVASLLERVLLHDKKSDPLTYAIIFQFLVGFISLIFTMLVGRLAIPSAQSPILRILFSGFLWTGATVFAFQAMKRLTAGEVVILASASTVVSVVLGTLFLAEQLTLPVVAGTALVLSAVWLINTGKLTFSSKAGVSFALFSAVCSGVAVVNDAVIVRSYEAFSYTTIALLLPGIILLGLFPSKIAALGKLLKPGFLALMVVFCLFYAVQAITYYLAFENGAPVSRLAPLVRSSIILTVVLGAVFLKERANLPRKIIAAIIVTIGVALLS